MIYFDNAATTFPKPDSVRQAVIMAMQQYGANPGRSGHKMAEDTARQIYSVREKAAELFGAPDPEQVAFTQNCTYALNLAIKGLLRPGDHVVISDLEHNSVLRPVYALAQNGMISYTVVKTDPDDPQNTVKAFAQAICPDTRAIISTHASNAFGCKLPVCQIGRLAREHGIYFILDAAQSAGIDQINMQEMQIDFLCMPGHKGLYGPSGTGLLIAKNGALLRPLVEGGTGSVSVEYTQPDFMPDRMESGTLNTSGIIGLGAGFDFIARNSLNRLATQEMEVVRRIWDGLHTIKAAKLYTEKPCMDRYVAVLSFNLEGISAEDVASKLNEQEIAVRGGLQCAPLAHRKFGTQQVGTVRISVGAFNTLEQADMLVQAVDEIAS